VKKFTAEHAEDTEMKKKEIFFSAISAFSAVKKEHYAGM
jgi:hypothetical protein